MPVNNVCRRHDVLMPQECCRVYEVSLNLKGRDIGGTSSCHNEQAKETPTHPLSLLLMMIDETVLTKVITYN